MVCIVFVKMNQTMFYRKMVYVKEGVCEKKSQYFQERRQEIRLYRRENQYLLTVRL